MLIHGIITLLESTMYRNYLLVMPNVWLAERATPLCILDCHCPKIESFGREWYSKPIQAYNVFCDRGVFLEIC